MEPLEKRIGEMKETSTEITSLNHGEQNKQKKEQEKIVRNIEIQ